MENRLDAYHLPVINLTAPAIAPAVFNYCHTYRSNYLLFNIPILLMYSFSL